MVNLNELRRTANDAVDDGYFVVPIDPAVVLALLDLLAAAESRCAALDEAVMRINAEHLDDVQRLGRERDEARRAVGYLRQNIDGYDSAFEHCGFDPEDAP